MKKFQSYVLNKFSFIDKEFELADLILLFKSLDLKFENAFQIQKIELYETSRLRIAILKRSPTFLYEYIEDELVKKETFLFNRSEFEIDFHHGYIITYGNLVNNLEIRQFFKRIDLGINIVGVNIDILSFFQKSQSIYPSVRVKSMTIKKFNFLNGMVGRFSGDIFDNSIVNNLLFEYNKDLAKIIFFLGNENIQYDVQIFPNGAFKIFSQEIDQFEILKDFIPIIL